MFTPGHVHRELLPDEFNRQKFICDVYYDVREDPKEGQMLHMRMEGEIDGKSFAEECELHRDMAFDFMNTLTQVVVRNGGYPRLGPVLRAHDEFDAMFKDIRDKLGLKPGDPIDLNHLPGL
ncbi:DUF5064 family protein [Azotobacter beijerinckii]|uniref:DUF5064 family protein n=1 Tax=Azotobacter beijerinckii TaxID=170623 RepID=UPI00295466EB|nr:DUF5064 family protein [Azotobacter beijerinckii]MDV7211060.1 DUF5064 family protein [Azotobacter beijerinckii]